MEGSLGKCPQLLLLRHKPFQLQVECLLGALDCLTGRRATQICLLLPFQSEGPRFSPTWVTWVPSIRLLILWATLWAIHILDT